MNTITEISRLSQLNIRQTEILAKAATEYGIQFYMLTAEIQNAINTMDVATAARAATWYVEANSIAQELAASHNVSVEIAAGVISAVSPRMPWVRNKNVADAILGSFRQYSALSAIDAAKQIGLALSVNVAMAIRIARSEDIEIALTGTKRRSFYNNIVSPLFGDSVTVDTWMIQAFCNVTGNAKKIGEKFVRANETALGGTGAGYIMLAESVRNVAAAMGLAPCAVQALYWVSQTGNHDGARPEIV